MTPLFVGHCPTTSVSASIGGTCSRARSCTTRQGGRGVHGRRRLLRPVRDARRVFAGTSLVEFSPTDRLNQTMEVVTKNMETAGS